MRCPHSFFYKSKHNFSTLRRVTSEALPASESPSMARQALHQRLHKWGSAGAAYIPTNTTARIPSLQHTASYLYNAAKKKSTLVTIHCRETPHRAAQACFISSAMLLNLLSPSSLLEDIAVPALLWYPACHLKW